jgi:hypothetical protein
VGRLCLRMKHCIIGRIGADPFPRLSSWAEGRDSLASLFTKSKDLPLFWGGDGVSDEQRQPRIQLRHKAGPSLHSDDKGEGRVRVPSAARAGRRPALLQRLDLRRHFPGSDVVALELAIERGAADPQHLAGQRLVTFHLFENALDCGALDVFQVGCGESG